VKSYTSFEDVCGHPPSRWADQNMSSTSKVRVGYLDHVCTNHVLWPSRSGTVTAASLWTTDAEFTVKVKPWELCRPDPDRASFSFMALEWHATPLEKADLQNWPDGDFSKIRLSYAREQRSFRWNPTLPSKMSAATHPRDEPIKTWVAHRKLGWAI
jgi:hypothetical protein